MRTPFGKVVTSALVGLSLVAGQVAIATTASASDYGYRHHRPLPRHVEQAPRHYGYHREQRRDRAGDAVAGIVLGIGALIVGAAIADAARHKNRTRDAYED